MRQYGGVGGQAGCGSEVAAKQAGGVVPHRKPVVHRRTSACSCSSSRSASCDGNSSGGGSRRGRRRRRRRRRRQEWRQERTSGKRDCGGLISRGGSLHAASAPTWRRWALRGLSSAAAAAAARRCCGVVMGKRRCRTDRVVWVQGCRRCTCRRRSMPSEGPLAQQQAALVPCQRKHWCGLYIAKE